VLTWGRLSVGVSWRPSLTTVVAAARDLCAALLPVVERVLGPEHPHTLTACANLARWTERAERGPGRT